MRSRLAGRLLRASRPRAFWMLVTWLALCPGPPRCHGPRASELPSFLLGPFSAETVAAPGHPPEPSPCVNWSLERGTRASFPPSCRPRDHPSPTAPCPAAAPGPAGHPPSPAQAVLRFARRVCVGGRVEPQAATHRAPTPGPSALTRSPIHAAPVSHPRTHSRGIHQEPRGWGWRGGGSCSLAVPAPSEGSRGPLQGTGHVALWSAPGGRHARPPPPCHSCAGGPGATYVPVHGGKERVPLDLLHAVAAGACGGDKAASERQAPSLRELWTR